MSDKQQARIVELQRQVKVARIALEHVRHGTRDPEGVADKALTDMLPLNPKQPLQGLVGHERRSQ